MGIVQQTYNKLVIFLKNAHDHEKVKIVEIKCTSKNTKSFFIILQEKN